MKKFYFFVLSLFFYSILFANPVITAQQDGSWNNKKTWDKDRAPKDGDTVVIPSGRLVSFDNLLFSETLKNVHIKISGTLRLAGGFSALILDNASSITIYSGGKLSSTGALQALTIGNKVVFGSGDPLVAGPQMASAASGGFKAFTPLPVKFVGFTLTRKNNDMLIQWSTSEEMNAAIYEVERSVDGNNWNTIGRVQAAGNSSIINNYAYTDKNISVKIVYYRIKQVDVDGTTAFTSIKSIRNDIAASGDIKIASVQNKVLLQFPQQVKGNILVRFVSMGGQVIDEKIISNPVGQVVLNSKFAGNYVIAISNGQDINTARQVIL